MKKFIVLFAAAVLAFVSISCGNPATSTPNEIILLNNNFDSASDNAVGNTPTGWTRAAIFETGDSLYYPVTNSASTSPDNSLMVYSLKKDFDRQIIKAKMNSLAFKTSGKINVEFNVNINFLMSGRAFVFYIDQIEKARLDFGVGGAMIYYTAGNTANSAPVTWAAGQWYKVKMILDLEADTYSWTIENNNMITGIVNIACNDHFEQKTDGTHLTAAESVYTDFFGILTNMDMGYADYLMYVDDVYISYEK
jgi:hypothetical protein